MRVLFFGEKPVGTAPTLTWAKALAKVNVTYHYIDFSEISTQDWIKEVKKSDVIICQWYGLVPKYEMRQLALASALGCPIVRKWSGSDIYFALNDTAIKASTLEFNKIVSLNLTSEHIGIVEELASIGIKAELIDQVINNIPTSPTSQFSHRVLAYLPDARPEFYGYSYIEYLINKYPETTFIIVADKLHKLAAYQNVQSLGWVEDMEPIWQDIGLLIRLTEHDGFPRSIVEALARKKYVIHNREFDGCWFANDHISLDKCFENFLLQTKANATAEKLIANLISDKPVNKLMSILGDLKPSFSIKVNSIYYAVKLSVS